MIVAETRVRGSLDEASNAGFRLIARYIEWLATQTVSTVEPVVLRASRSRCACAASFSG